MKYRTMGRWGVQLSTIGLGSWYTLGTTVGKDDSVRLIHGAMDLGINFFDTANVYTNEWGTGTGDAERLLGEALRSRPRHDAVICTKVRGKMGEGPNAQGLSYKHIIEQCNGSLQRLGVDHIDVYMCHRHHGPTPVDETVRAMETLRQQGKICYWAVSNWKAWRIQQAMRACAEQGAAPIACCEPRYNLLFRYPELELFPSTEADGMGHVVFSPLAQGMLTGKYKPGEEPPAGSRAADAHDGKYMRGVYYSEFNKQRSQILVDIAEELHTTAGNVALAWVLRNPQVTSAIIGAKSLAQVEENVQAVELELTDEVVARLEAAFPVPRGPWLREGEIPFDLAAMQEQELA